MALTLLLPWRIKRHVLVRVFGFEIAATAHIGVSWLGMQHLIMRDGSRIGHLNVFKSLDLVELDEYASIGRMNLFTCVPTVDRRHFQHIPERSTQFRLGRHSRVTMRHLFDCNAPIRVDNFTTLAGYGSQYLTHSIDVVACRQDAHAITIGAYCFVGTACVLLGGTSLPDYSVLAAGSVAREAFDQPRSLYAGVPARRKKEMPPETKYWQRDTGWIA